MVVKLTFCVAELSLYSQLYDSEEHVTLENKPLTVLSRLTRHCLTSASEALAYLLCILPHLNLLLYLFIFCPDDVSQNQAKERSLW